MSGTFHELSRKSIFLYALPHGGGGGYGENIKVTRPKHHFFKCISGMELFCAMTLQIFLPKPGNPREGGHKGGTNGREGEREGPERSLVTS